MSIPTHLTKVKSAGATFLVWEGGLGDARPLKLPERAEKLFRERLPALEGRRQQAFPLVARGQCQWLYLRRARVGPIFLRNARQDHV